MLSKIVSKNLAGQRFENKKKLYKRLKFDDKDECCFDIPVYAFYIILMIITLF